MGEGQYWMKEGLGSNCILDFHADPCAQALHLAPFQGPAKGSAFLAHLPTAQVSFPFLSLPRSGSSLWLGGVCVDRRSLLMVVYYLKQGLSMNPEVVWDSQSSCLSAGVIEEPPVVDHLQSSVFSFQT